MPSKPWLVAGAIVSLSALAEFTQADPQWTRLDPMGAPPPTVAGTLVYDSNVDRLLLFGGLAPGVRTNDVWALRLTPPSSWTLLSPSGTRPRARMGHVAVFDSAGNRMIVHGGSGSGPLTDVWELRLGDSLAWRLLSPSGAAPTPRYLHAAAWDASRRRMIVNGGTGSGSFADTWALELGDTARWVLLHPATGSPGARSGHTLVHDPLADRALLFGGSFPTPPNRVDALELGGTPVWSVFDPGGFALPAGPRTSSHTSVFDPVRRQMVVFGGMLSGTPFDSTWTMSASAPPTWTRLAFAGLVPAGREKHAAVWDSRRGCMWVFGGATGSLAGDVLSDVWSLRWDDVAATGRTVGSVLTAARPNPARQGVTFVRSAGAVEETIEVFDPTGRCVAHVEPDGGSASGAARWDLRDGQGARVPPGLYFARAGRSGARLRFVVLR